MYLYSIIGSMKNISSYSSPFNLGHKALEELFDGDVYIQEKIDGSQLSFRKDAKGKLFIRSRNQDIDLDDAGMFSRGVEAIRELDLTPEYTYRGEFLGKPKQNTLAYDRVPKQFVIIFDIDNGDQDYLLPSQVDKEAQRVGLEHAPFYGIVTEKPKVEELQRLLKNKSILGDVPIEGIVLKNYDQFGRDKKVLMGKFVSGNFIEKHSKDWSKRHPNRNEVITRIIEMYRTVPRWEKAVQHLKEDGKLEMEPRDIGILVREIQADILSDSEDEIKEQLFKHFKQTILRGSVKGFPEWYKTHLAELNA